MIEHSIEVHKAPAFLGFLPRGSRKSRPEIGSEQHKVEIFGRALEKCHYKAGDYVTYKGDAGQIIDVIDRYTAMVAWDGLKPLFIEVMSCDDGNSFLVHPSDIRKLKS